MKRILLLCCFLLLVACKSSEEFTFQGESDNWTAKLTVYQQKDYEEQQFLLRYLGEDVNSVGELSYQVETNAGGTRVSDQLPENGIITHTSRSTDAAKVTKGSAVRVSVTWDGGTESILLK